MATVIEMRNSISITSAKVDTQRKSTRLFFMNPKKYGFLRSQTLLYLDSKFRWIRMEFASFNHIFCEQCSYTSPKFARCTDESK